MVALLSDIFPFPHSNYIALVLNCQIKDFVLFKSSVCVVLLRFFLKVGHVINNK